MNQERQERSGSVLSPFRRIQAIVRNLAAQNRSVPVLVCVFVISRLAYHFLLGMRFNADTLTSFWQFIDPLLLKTELFKSLYYLHSQPPLFNCFLGVILKLFPDSFAAVFQWIYLLIGLIFSVSLFKLMSSEASKRRGKANGAEISVRALAYVIVGHEIHHMNVLRTRYLEGVQAS